MRTIKMPRSNVLDGLLGDIRERIAFVAFNRLRRWRAAWECTQRGRGKRPFCLKVRISQKRDSGFANCGTAVSLNHGQCGDGSFRLRG